ncbi:MAG: FkbM family methyltransferase [Desulfuromonadales bacterium]
MIDSKPSFDIEWLTSQARNDATVNKIKEIALWREKMLATNSFNQENEPFILELGGLKLQFFPYSAVGALEVYQEVFRDNDHRLLPDFIGKEAVTVVDVGANQGLYALRAKLENPDCHVYCLEPNPIEHATLLTNIRLNSIHGIEVFNLAIGDSGKEIDFEYLPNAGAISGRSIRTVPRSWMREEFISHCRTNQRTLDEFCRYHNISHIDILKIDTEGMEIEVLSGGNKTLSISDRIVIERHSAELRHAVVQLLDAEGFDLVHEEDPLLSRYYADIYFRKRVA